MRKKRKLSGNKQFDNLWLGVLIGLTGPFFGFLTYGLIFTWTRIKTYDHYVYDVFLSSPHYASKIIAISLLFNLFPFYLFYYTKRDYSSKGLILGTMGFIPIIIYLNYLA